MCSVSSWVVFIQMFIVIHSCHSEMVWLVLKCISNFRRQARLFGQKCIQVPPANSKSNSKILLHWANFKLGEQINTWEMGVWFPQDFDLSGNLNYPFSDKAGGTCSRGVVAWMSTPSSGCMSKYTDDHKHFIFLTSLSIHIPCNKKYWLCLLYQFVLLIMHAEIDLD